LTNNLDYKDIMDQIFDLEEYLVVIRGFSDIYRYELPFHSPFFFKDLKSENFWILMGRVDNDSILEALVEYDFEVDKEGEYEFKAILKYIKGDYSTGESGYWEIKHIEFELIQTFQEREREYKLNELLNFNNLFE
jgi:hypothetical protein